MTARASRQGERFSRKLRMVCVFLVVSIALIGIKVTGVADILVQVISQSEVAASPSVNAVHPTARLSNLASYAEATEIADQYLSGKLGQDFVKGHFESIGVEQRPDVPYIWFVLYRYGSNGYEVELSVAVDAGYVEPGASRVRWEASRMIEKPQEVRLSAEVAEAIASERGLQGPYNATLSFHWESRRIVWMVTRGCPCNLGETIGYTIDAEDGTILQEVRNLDVVPLPILTCSVEPVEHQIQVCKPESLTTQRVGDSGRTRLRV